MLFPHVPLGSATVEYMVLLIIVGIPFLTLVVLAAVELDKRQRDKGKEGTTVLRPLLVMSKDNLVFWTIIVLLNLIAFWLE
jgi:hypothetical protein